MADRLGDNEPCVVPLTCGFRRGRPQQLENQPRQATGQAGCEGADSIDGSQTRRWTQSQRRRRDHAPRTNAVQKGRRQGTSLPVDNRGSDRCYAAADLQQLREKQWPERRRIVLAVAFVWRQEPCLNVIQRALNVKPADLGEARRDNQSVVSALWEHPKHRGARSEGPELKRLRARRKNDRWYVC